MEIIYEKAQKISNLLKNFSNPKKLAILCYIGKDKKNVSDILEKCDISQSQVSQFLNKMKLEKIVDSTKNGKEVFYYIVDKDTSLLIDSLKKNFL